MNNYFWFVMVNNLFWCFNLWRSGYFEKLKGYVKKWIFWRKYCKRKERKNEVVEFEFVIVCSCFFFKNCLGGE